MNRERITKLAEWFEAGAPHKTIKFVIDQGITVTNIDEAQDAAHLNACQTACCIAGATVQFFDPKFSDEMLLAIVDDYEHGDYIEQEDPSWVQGNWPPVKHRAAELLGVEGDDILFMFEPYGFTDYPEQFTAEATGKMLRHYLATGKVKWDVPVHNNYKQEDQE